MKNLLTINPKKETNKIISFLKQTFRKQRIDKVVIGLSGGIDSTVALYLIKEALSKKNIYAVQMDYNPRKKSNIDLKGINVINVSIKKIIEEFSPLPAEIKKFYTESLTKKIRLGNIMARVRMIILFDLAKKYRAMVCGTENKSEKLLGYFTRFGDSASDIEPISHLYKTQVLQLAKYLKVPKEIINRKPTAGLWNGQTDEGEFGFTYKEADQVLYLTHDRGQDKKKIKKMGFKNVKKIIKRFLDNQFKLKTPYSL